MEYSSLTGHNTNEINSLIPSKDQFKIFIKPECSCKSTDTSSCNDITYIPQSDTERDTIFLKHKTRYNIGILNNSEGDCLAIIYVDGEFCGKFRIDKKSSFQLERPIDKNQSFVFVSKNSELGNLTGLSNTNLGEILVHIIPEDKSSKVNQSIAFKSASVKFETDGFTRQTCIKKNRNASNLGDVISKSATVNCESNGHTHQTRVKKIEMHLI